MNLNCLSLVATLATLFLNTICVAAPRTENRDARRFIQVAAQNEFQRSDLATLGMSVEAVRSDSVWGIATPAEIDRIRGYGFQILGNFPVAVARGGHEGSFEFPGDDLAYHNFDRLLRDLQALQGRNADISRLISIGKSLEGRDLVALHINTHAGDLQSNQSAKPGIIFMGAHHAREHLSVEVPLKLAQYLLDNRGSPAVARLLDSRDIWIIPMVNPDGAEFDISTGEYDYWRKNRRNNGDGNYGVDLNRNYGFEWGTGGSSKDTASEVYMGPQPFSEPETQAVRDFVRSQKNTKVLLTFHTYSELILYPWGHTHQPISNAKDLAVFKKMAQTMAKWNHYKPEPASGLYIASGDTVDWAYGELGIFGFTFEMSPGGSFGANGFYPGVKMIDKAFNDNLQPCLYLIDTAGNPYAVVNGSATERWMYDYGQSALLTGGWAR